MAKSRMLPHKQPAGLHGVDEAHAPFVSFDRCPVIAVVDGSIRVTLLSVRSVPTREGTVREDFIVTGYLRCGPAAAAELRDALDKALLLGTPTRAESQ